MTPTTKATDKAYYLIETSGEARQVWGPYTLAHAKRQAGVRHTIVTGTGLSNGQTMPDGHVHAAFQSGRIRTVDGSALS